MTTTSPPVRRSKQQEFREKLASRAMVADGAMGTVLYSKGVFINRCFDELNLSAPAMIRSDSASLPASTGRVAMSPVSLTWAPN